ncbi:pyruvate/2-oxoglutarate dehydrogenase complex, dehydrogenase component beta subunit [Opitutaceae bacterium TAV1]|nr:pyruvate/2-oxoglutarate dehydrogenase complex, dehydrogenase component beta subunit [Opitutaceae bacterium TAV1]
MAFPQIPAILAERDISTSDLNTPPALVRLYAWMFYARVTDDRIVDLFRQGLIKGTAAGGQGNEGLIIPLALLADKAIDVISFTHRDLGGHLIWSGHLCEHLDQYFANSQSPTRAREGNVHHGDPANRSLPMISHLGSMISNVAGLADAQRRADKPAVGFALFGDGGSSTGDIHETLNLASLLSLPVVFIVENNDIAYSTPVSEQYPAGVELWTRAAAYNMEGRFLDATDDPEKIARQLADAIDTVRSTSRPLLIEARTLRLRGHAAYDTRDYLSAGQIQAIDAADPLPRFRTRLVAEGHAALIEKHEQDIRVFIEDCIKVSLAVPPPSPSSLPPDAFAPSTTEIAWKPDLGPGSAGAPEPLTLAQAINRGLRKILAERPESLLLGQDIGVYGGAFKVTEHLLRDFGRARVFNTPLAESACTGYATGLALGGIRTIEEFQFADFSTEAVTQITQNAATYHYRSGAKVPMVFRFPCGGGITVGSFHSQELETLFLAFPGIKALYPSTPQDAFNALLAAYEDDNPVCLFEHKGLYRRGKHPVSWDPAWRDVWQPRHVRAGDFATLVTYGEMVHHATEAASYLENEYERAIDLFDLRALSPLRLEQIEASLARTHRLIVIHEGHRTHGFGAELVARLTEKHFFDLEAPPLRIASLDIPVPFAPELEAVYRPARDSIIGKIVEWLG